MFVPRPCRTLKIIGYQLHVPLQRLIGLELLGMPLPVRTNTRHFFMVPECKKGTRGSNNYGRRQ